MDCDQLIATPIHRMALLSSVFLSIPLLRLSLPIADFNYTPFGDRALTSSLYRCGSHTMPDSCCLRHSREFFEHPQGVKGEICFLGRFLRFCPYTLPVNLEGVE